MKHSTRFSHWVALILCISNLSFNTSLVLAAAAEAVQITEDAGKIKVAFGGHLFTEYYYENVPRPYLYPILGPGDAPMTRNWPMQEVAGEERDHPHHKSLWFTHGNVNGIDFWTDGAAKGRIEHVKFLKTGVDNGIGVIQSSNRWVTPENKIVLTDERTLKFMRRGDETVLDFIVTLYASQSELKFGDTKEGSMAIRVAETMRLKGKTGQGHIINSEGLKDAETWGKRAAWCDYYGPVSNKIVGVAMFDHPQNPRYPTWWHVRDYGLFAANPFGIHDFEKAPAGTGDWIIPEGKSATFHYRFYFHPGDEKEGRVAERYKEFISEKN